MYHPWITGSTDLVILQGIKAVAFSHESLHWNLGGLVGEGRVSRGDNRAGKLGITVPCSGRIRCPNKE